MYPLFDAYPGLADQLPRLAIADLPTAVEPLECGGVTGLYIKRDDRAALPYGGNKVRKLELLLGHARAAGYPAVLTYGCVGSNHALATALYARAQGLGAISILFPQPVSRAVRRNLLRHHASGAWMLHCNSGREGAAATRTAFRETERRTGRYPFVIAPGGSSPVGAIGFVNAAFELRSQVEAGLLPVPEAVYVASGTMGTCVGLLLGLRAAGMETRVIATAVTVAPYTSPQKARILYGTLNAQLHDADPAFPVLPFPEERFALREEFLGPGYGQFTEAGMAAVAEARAAGIALEGTYTGKAFAALLADARAGLLDGKTTLFWDTYNSQPLDTDADIDYHCLPDAFYRYFEEPLQALES